LLESVDNDELFDDDNGVQGEYSSVGGEEDEEDEDDDFVEIVDSAETRSPKSVPPKEVSAAQRRLLNFLNPVKYGRDRDDEKDYYGEQRLLFL
jgi:hypothetical protein